MVESADFFEQKARYDAFLEEHKNDKVLFRNRSGLYNATIYQNPFQNVYKLIQMPCLWA